MHCAVRARWQCAGIGVTGFYHRILIHVGWALLSCPPPTGGLRAVRVAIVRSATPLRPHA